jgi:hypothetical protein
LLVLLVALVERSLLWGSYQPVRYSDSNSYRRLADALLADGLSRYDGTRTPGYPLLMAWAGSDERLWLVQMGLGLIATFLIFYLGWQLSGKPWFGGVAALAHTLNLGQLFFEANLLSETASTFWLLLALAGLVFWLSRPSDWLLWRRIGLGLALGIVVTLSWLTRPLFIFLPFWLLVFLLPGWVKGKPVFSSRALVGSLAFAFTTTTLLAYWVSFIHSTYHVWSLTTMTGYHLVQHTGEYFEYVPDRYAVLRDIYLKYRDERIARYGTQVNTIWEAIPEMQKASGKTFFDLSRLLTQISLQLIREHPDLYLKNVAQGWWMFWWSPVYWKPELIRSTGLAQVLQALVLLERALLVGSNILFIATSLVALFRKGARVALRVGPAWWSLLGVGWIASLIQTLTDHGDNPRFLVPLQSLVVLWVLWVGLQTLQYVAGKKGVVYTEGVK